MGNPRSFTTKYVAIKSSLEQALKANGITKTRRPKFIERAKAGRPDDLAVQARRALADRRVQRDLDIIAGTIQP